MSTRSAISKKRGEKNLHVWNIISHVLLHSRLFNPACNLLSATEKNVLMNCLEPEVKVTLESIE